MSAVSPYALHRAYVVSAGNLGIAAAEPIDGARDAYLVAGDTPRPLVVREAEFQPAVHWYQFLIYPDIVRQHRIFLHHRTGGVFLHAPKIGGICLYADGVRYRFKLGVVSHQIHHQPQLVFPHPAVPHDRPCRVDERPPAHSASKTLCPVFGFAKGND